MVDTASNAPFRGVKTDITSKPPMFNIPVLGHLLNILPEVAGFVYSQIPSLTPAGSPALKMAQQQGVGYSWQQREDVSDPMKLATEMAVANVVPPFAVIGPMAKVSTAMTKPLVSGLRAAGRALPNAPVVGGLFRLSNRGQVNALNEDLGWALDYAKQTGVEPNKLVGALEATKGQTLTPEASTAVRDSLGMNPAQFDIIRKYYEKIPPTQIEMLTKALGTNPSGFYNELLDTAKNSLAQELNVGPSGPTSTLGRLYQSALNLQREVAMSSGFTWIPNALDISAKWTLEQLRPTKLVSNAVELAKTGDLSDYRALVGSQQLEGRLGLNRAGMMGLPAEAKTVLLDKLTPLQRVGVGAASGIPSGNPVDIGANAIAALATPEMFKFNRQLMEFWETVARKGMMTEFAVKQLESESPKILASLTNELGPQKGPQLFQQIKAVGFKTSPESVQEVARQLGFQPDEISRATSVWRDFQGNAIEFGIGESNRINFPYTRDTNLTAALRNAFLFPVWPTHNLPYYAEKAVQYPAIPSVIGEYAQQTEENQQEKGLTSRFNLRAPLLGLATGTVYGNPLAPLSISGQINEPPAPPPDAQQTVLDKILDWSSLLGLSPLMSAQIPLQVGGLIDQQRDIQSVLPLSRYTQPAVEALTGQPSRPEEFLNAPLTGLREAIAPESLPAVEYPEYLVRKKLAELSIERTGKGWWQNEDYQRAMIDSKDALRSEAQKLVGEEQAALYTGRRLVPLQLGYLPKAEEQIRTAKTQLGTIPEGLTGAEYGQLVEDNPLAFGYRWISSSAPKLNLQVKQDMYFQLPSGSSRTIFEQENPDLAAYLTWASTERKAGRKPNIDDYLKKIGVT